MKSTRYLPAIKSFRSEVQKRASRGERIIGSLFPTRGTGWPGGWSQDRLEQVLHLRHWVYCAVDYLCCCLGSIFPNIAYVTNEEKPGKTVKAGHRGLRNLLGRGEGFGGLPYIGARGTYEEKGFHGEYVGTDFRQEAPSFDGMGGGHSFLTMGEYRSKALSVVKPHENLEPIEPEHLLRRLIQNPNAYDTFFTYTYEKWMFGELCGVSYQWKVPNDFGIPVERWVIPSHWVWPRTGGLKVPDGGARNRMRGNGSTSWEFDPDGEVGDNARYRASYVPYDHPFADRLIQYYEVRPWGGMGSAGILRIPPNEIIMTKWPSPINKIDGYSKLAAIAQWIDSEESISEDQVRDMVLAAWRVSTAALGQSKEMTFGSILATLMATCTNCLNPRLALDGEVETKNLASLWDEKAPAYSTRTANGYGGKASTRKLRIWYDDTTPADPSQVNADIEADLHAKAVTPNEVRALRGKKPYRYGGDDPILDGPSGPTPYPLNTKEDLSELATALEPMASMGGEGDGNGNGMPPGAGNGNSHGHSPNGNGNGDNGNGNGNGENGDDNGNGDPALQNDDQSADFEGGGKVENPNGPPQKVGDIKSLYHNRITKVHDSDDTPQWEGIRLSLPLETLASADFVKLPGGVEGTNCENCKWESQGQCWYPDLAGQEVDETICCKFWDNDDTKRPWISKGWTHPAVRKAQGEEEHLLDRSGLTKEVAPEQRPFGNRSWSDPDEGIQPLPGGEEDPIKIHLPEVRQSTNYSCGAACLMSVCLYHGIGPQTEEEFIQFLPSDPIEGTNPANVIQLADRLGLTYEERQGLTVDQLRKAADLGIPSILLVQAWFTNYDDATRERFANDDDGHYVVFIGYDDDVLYFMDPAVKGTRSHISADEFLERWHDRGVDSTPYTRWGLALFRTGYSEPMKSFTVDRPGLVDGMAFDDIDKDKDKGLIDV